MYIRLLWFIATYLLVEHNVDDRVVDGRTLGKESWQCHEDWAEIRALMGEDEESYTGIGNPTNQEENHHDNDHSGDLFLSLLSGG